MKQNTEEWLKWRSEGIGSSDIPIILGLSEHKTALQLYQERLGLRQVEDTQNFAMLRGSAMESAAREWYRTTAKIYDCEPACFEYPNNRIMRASLDGWSPSARRLVEIKCLGDSKNHRAAADGIVPPAYWAQVQFQMLVTDTKVADYFSFNGRDGTVVEVLADEDYQLKIYAAAMEFWLRLQSKDPPPFSDRDYKPIHDPMTLALIEEYRYFRAVEIETAAKVKSLKKEIEKRLDHKRHEAPGLKIWQVTRQGNVQLHTIPELKDVDLDKYRSSPSTSYVFKISSEKGNEID